MVTADEIRSGIEDLEENGIYLKIEPMFVSEKTSRLIWKVTPVGKVFEHIKLAEESDGSKYCYKSFDGKSFWGSDKAAVLKEAVDNSLKFLSDI